MPWRRRICRKSTLNTTTPRASGWITLLHRIRLIIILMQQSHQNEYGHVNYDCRRCLWRCAYGHSKAARRFEWDGEGIRKGTCSRGLAIRSNAWMEFAGDGDTTWRHQPEEAGEAFTRCCNMESVSAMDYRVVMMVAVVAVSGEYNSVHRHQHITCVCVLRYTIPILLRT